MNNYITNYFQMKQVIVKWNKLLQKWNKLLLKMKQAIINETSYY